MNFKTIEYKAKPLLLSHLPNLFNGDAFNLLDQAKTEGSDSIFFCICILQPTGQQGLLALLLKYIPNLPTSKLFYYHYLISCSD